MSRREEQTLAQDRALRDSARALVLADIEHLKTDFRSKGIGARVIDRAGEGAVDIFEEAKELAGNNRGIVATLVAAIFVWFARAPLADLFGAGDEDEADEDWENEEWDDENVGAESDEYEDEYYD